MAELGVAETTVFDFTLERGEAGAGGLRPRAAGGRGGGRRRRRLPLRPEASRRPGAARAAGVRGAAGAAARGRLVDRDPPPPARGRGAGGGAPARPAARARRHRRRRRPARRHARLSDGEPRGRAGAARAAYGIYAGSALGHRAAISIGTNPHYGGEERRIEPHLLDFEGDLYGTRLVVELWERLRDEQVFESEQELVDQIARDVEATREAVRPA